MTLRNGEYGKKIQMGIEFDASSNTALAILATPQSGTLKTWTATLGTTLLSTPLGEFAANHWIEYTLLSGDIDEAGDWTFQPRYDEGATKRLLGEVACETVE